MKNHTQLTGNLQKSFQEEGAGKRTGKKAFSTKSRRPGWLEHSDPRQTLYPGGILDLGSAFV